MSYINRRNFLTTFTSGLLGFGLAKNVKAKWRGTGSFLQDWGMQVSRISGCCHRRFPWADDPGPDRLPHSGQASGCWGRQGVRAGVRLSQQHTARWRSLSWPPPAAGCLVPRR